MKKTPNSTNYSCRGGLDVLFFRTVGVKNKDGSNDDKYLEPPTILVGAAWLNDCQDIYLNP